MCVCLEYLNIKMIFIITVRCRQKSHLQHSHLVLYTFLHNDIGPVLSQFLQIKIKDAQSPTYVTKRKKMRTKYFEGCLFTEVFG